jgi:hypothetical protein
VKFKPGDKIKVLDTTSQCLWLIERIGKEAKVVYSELHRDGHYCLNVVYSDGFNILLYSDVETLELIDSSVKCRKFKL